MGKQIEADDRIFVVHYRSVFPLYRVLRRTSAISNAYVDEAEREKRVQTLVDAVDVACYFLNARDRNLVALRVRVERLHEQVPVHEVVVDNRLHRCEEEYREDDEFGEMQHARPRRNEVPLPPVRPTDVEERLFVGRFAPRKTDS